METLNLGNVRGATGDTGATGATGAGYDGVTSTSSVAIAKGSKTLTVNKVGAFIVGSRVRIINTTTKYLAIPALGFTEADKVRILANIGIDD